MKRPASAENNLERIRAWRETCPELTIRSTFIVGFPGETEADFEELLNFLEEARLDRVGCFSYSPVEGAAANALPGAVAEPVKEERRSRLMSLQERISAERLKREGVRVRLTPEDRAAIYEEDGELHPVRYVRGLAAAAVAAGARMHDGTRAVAVSKDEVRTERARVRAGAVVVCVNAYSRHLIPLRVKPVRGQMLATAPVPQRIFERPAYANRGYRYWRQRADGSLLIGGWRDTAADEEVGEEERTTPRIQQQLDTFLSERCPDAKVAHRWAGTMGFSHDALPYVGALDTGVFVNAGFTGHGMAFATATGELVADLLRGEKRNETDLFAPERR
jgi:glycine/D-amino acid oxidase-like deaminating enzyme